MISWLIVTQIWTLSLIKILRLSYRFTAKSQTTITLRRFYEPNASIEQAKFSTKNKTIFLIFFFTLFDTPKNRLTSALDWYCKRIPRSLNSSDENSSRDFLKSVITLHEDLFPFITQGDPNPWTMNVTSKSAGKNRQHFDKHSGTLMVPRHNLTYLHDTICYDVIIVLSQSCFSFSMKNEN